MSAQPLAGAAALAGRTLAGSAFLAPPNAKPVDPPAAAAGLAAPAAPPNLKPVPEQGVRETGVSVCVQWWAQWAASAATSECCAVLGLGLVLMLVLGLGCVLHVPPAAGFLAAAAPPPKEKPVPPPAAGLAAPPPKEKPAAETAPAALAAAALAPACPGRSVSQDTQALTSSWLVT